MLFKLQRNNNYSEKSEVYYGPTERLNGLERSLLLDARTKRKFYIAIIYNLCGASKSYCNAVSNYQNRPNLTSKQWERNQGRPCLLRSFAEKMKRLFPSTITYFSNITHLYSYIKCSLKLSKLN